MVKEQGAAAGAMGEAEAVLVLTCQVLSPNED